MHIKARQATGIGETMVYGNVLVIGNSGVGKSTLVNAVLGEDKAVVGGGDAGVTKSIEVYVSKDPKVPFRIIDTIGFEPSLVKRHNAIKAVRDWSKRAAKDGDPDTDINVIWFCVEGTSKKLFPEAIHALSKATKLWESVPVIVVITKSYSQTERAENIKTVQNAFARQKKYTKNLKEIIPVVAEAYPINETTLVPPDGIDELIDATNRHMPEGKTAAEKDVAAFKLRRKRAMARGLVGSFTTAGATVGAFPMPVADAVVLSTLEATEVNALASIYEIKRNEASKEFLSTIIEMGTVSVAARAAISAIKAIPGMNIAASVLDAVIAGSFVAAIGQGSAYAFEQVYLGERSLDDLDWLRKLIESELSRGFVDKAAGIIRQVSEGETPKNVSGLIAELVRAAFVRE
jgi:GTPase Era involved in 16S rRNA processing/uncharacterized protein (DUF697 family)